MSISIRLRAILLATFAAIIVTAQPPSPDEDALYRRALSLIEANQFDRARLTLSTLLNVYPKTGLRAPANTAIRTSWVRQGIADPDAFLLFQEAQTRVAAGKREAALLAFETLVNVYPASDCARQAKHAIAALQPK